MSSRGVHIRSTARGATLVAAILCGLVACKDKAAPAPAGPVVRDPARRRAPKPVAPAVRDESSPPFEPWVVPDEPPSAPTQPVPEAQPAKADTMNGHPNGITRDALNRAIQDAVPSMAACFSTQTDPPKVSISFEADPNGRPSLVRVGGSPGNAEYCLRNAVRAIRFPPFEGNGVQVDLPLNFTREMRPGTPTTTVIQRSPQGDKQLFISP